MHETVSFPVQFNNFGGSGGTSIYIDIANAEDIYHINERIQMKGSLYFPGLLNRSTFNNQACIFIAKRLNVTQYEAARNEFRYRNYRAQWEMKQVCLLRKNTYTGSFEKVQSFKCRRTKTSVMSKVG